MAITLVLGGARSGKSAYAQKHAEQAAVLTGRCPRGAPILVQLPGGTLEVCVQRDDTVLLTGDAAATFSGTVLIQPCKAPRGVV